MNHREPPHPPAAARRALLWVTLALVPALAPLGARTLPPGALPPGKSPLHSAPYLIALGAPPLIFQEALVARVANVPPPPVATYSTPAPVVETTPAANIASTPLDSRRAETEAPVPETNLTRKEPTNEAKLTPSILPDDVRPRIRPEDFLQYFQIPGSARHSDDVNLLVPVPRSVPVPPALPPSSATYTTTPK